MFRRLIGGGVCHSKARLDGKTVIVTGSNTGIGKETARDMARRGAKVIMACRNLDKANAAANEIREDPQVTGTIVVKQLDLASFESIRKFAKEILESEDKIDILINNAGLMCPKDRTKDGFDMVFGANHLGPFLLTNLLLDRIKASAPARIVNVSSTGHKFGRMNWDDLNYDHPNTYTPFKAYCQSKLANILFSRELADRLAGTGVTTYSLHPGAVRTEFSRYDQGRFINFIFSTSHKFYKDATQGAQTTIYCAVDEAVKDQTGLYYADCAVTKPSKKARSKDDAERLWAESLDLVQVDKSD